MFLAQYYQHPSLIILLSIVGMTFLKDRHYAFKAISIITPLICMVALSGLEEKNILSVSQVVKLSYIGSWHNKLIGFAFLLAILAANLNTINKKRYIEIILGNLYAAFTLFCLLAGDFLSLFISLELMAITSAIIIFIGEQKASLRAAKKYFITHLMSGNMIIIGVIHLYSISGSVEIQNVGELVYHADYSNFMLSIMFVGLLINVASFPFTGWMVNYYPKATSTGFVYLMMFTTKLSVMLIVKLFAGFDALKYAAVIMIINSCTQVIFEKHVQNMLCHLSIISMGLMLMGISDGSVEVVDAVVCYLFMHILYKLTLCLACSNLSSYSFDALFNHDSKIIKFSLVVSVIAMIAVPSNFVFTLKGIITHNFYDNLLTYVALIVMSFSISFALPWREFFCSNNKIETKLNKCSKYALLITLSTTIFFMIFGQVILLNKEFTLFPEGSVKQILILTISIIAACFFKYKRFRTHPLNLIEPIGSWIFYFHRRQDEREKQTQSKEPMFENLEFQLGRFFNLFHNQQTAIFMVFVVLIIVMCIIVNQNEILRLPM
ncbi:MAG: hypothetical protein DGJ47_000805 [Rickettsiaceae bacterium]